ncbi:MAG: hypothetical protein AVO35_09505 [Candidatus Aegiribacteria sp. MLS_C]|nr:MAG: hypothetical protein AVO35_09505 [Candidatus Aegiribacteria sp. MLS_C]
MKSSLGGRIRSFLGMGGRQGRRLGVALGGGGARGLAHVPVLELLDEMGIRPVCMAGTSIGAVIGALYASGMSGSDIRGLVDDTVLKKGDPPNKVMRNLKTVIRFLDLDFMGSGMFKGESFMDYFYDAIDTDSFEELDIPLKVVTSDFWTAGQVVVSEGELISAVRASMSLPGIFTPVERDGRVLVDGGGVDPVPWDLLEDCDLVLAVDVLGSLEKGNDDEPSAFRAVVEMFDIMQRSMVRTRLDSSPPDIYFRPELKGIGLLEFHRAEEIYKAAESSIDQLREQLAALS